MVLIIAGLIRITEVSAIEEPGAGKLYAGICAGGAGQPVSLPRRPRKNQWKLFLRVMESRI